MKRKIFTFLSVLLVLTSAALAQTGRISGRVLDIQTQEPLIGANIIIIGSNYGAATDVNGNYTILNVPVGVYNLQASYIGYQEVTVQQVRITSGLTEEVNFNLPSESIATEEVIIVAEKPLIEKSATNAVRIVSSEDLTNLPVRNINEVVALQPGVVRQNEMTFIRGSRADETGYVLEGADIKNILNRTGGSLVSVVPDALHEVLVQAGGYTAEYGNANAGIIQQDFKTGTDEYHFSIRAETDNFGNANTSDKFLGTYSYGYSDYVVTASGPLFSNKLKLFLSGENAFVRDYDPMFFSSNPVAFSDGALFDTTKVYDTGIYGGNTNEYQYLRWGGGAVPGRMQQRYTFNGTALLDLKPLMLKLSGAFTWGRKRANDNDFVFVNNDIPDILDISNLFNLGRLPHQDVSNLLLNLKGTYFILDQTYLEANVNFLDNRQKIYDPYYIDDYLSYNDSLKGSKFGWVYDNYTEPPNAYDFYGFPFARNGDLTTNYLKDHRYYLGGSLALTSQIGQHALKAGGSYQYWTVRRYQTVGATAMLNLVRNNPDLSRNPDSLQYLFQNQGFTLFNNYGYDLLGNEVDSGPYDAKHPVLASAYIEDKLEMNDLIINAGLRFDFIDMDSWKWSNPKLPLIDNDTHFTDQLIESSTYSYVSPRLGFSFPVTDRTVFHLQYGKFVQSPSLDVTYRGIHQATTQVTGRNLYTNPIAYGLEPVRTTQYEIGFTQQFTDFAAFDITAFYKDIKGQIQYGIVKTIAGAQKSQYSAFLNQDFSTTKGVELSLRIRRVERIRAEINYTLSDSKGTNSFWNSSIGSVEVNNVTPTVLLPLQYDQTHRGSILLDYRFEEGDGGPILEQLGLDVLFTFNSGHPFTQAQGIDATGLGQQSAYSGGLINILDTRGRRSTGPVNQARTPWFYNIDLRIDKTVNISEFDVNFYVYVMNLLNTKNVINVYDRTGNGFDDGFLGSQAAAGYSQRFKDLYRAINLENRQAALSIMTVDMWSTPRQLRAGVLVNF